MACRPWPALAGADGDEGEVALSDLPQGALESGDKRSTPAEADACSEKTFIEHGDDASEASGSLDATHRIARKAKSRLGRSGDRPLHRSYVSDVEATPGGLASPMSRAGRELQDQHSEATLLTALMNYEVFNKLPRGTTACEVVAGTSAGIVGWATAELDAEDIAQWLCEPKGDAAQAETAAETAPTVAPAAAERPSPEAKETRSGPSAVPKGDAEEQEALQSAILQSAREVGFLAGSRAPLETLEPPPADDASLLKMPSLPQAPEVALPREPEGGAEVGRFVAAELALLREKLAQTEAALRAVCEERDELREERDELCEELVAVKERNERQQRLVGGLRGAATVLEALRVERGSGVNVELEVMPHGNTVRVGALEIALQKSDPRF